MPAKTDLTWAELNTAFGSSIFEQDTDSYGVSSVKLNVTKLLGKSSVDALADSGVVETLLKLREVCAVAQVTANVGQVLGERLDAFPPATFAALANNAAPVTATIKARVPVITLGQATIVGANI